MNLPSSGVHHVWFLQGHCYEDRYLYLQVVELFNIFNKNLDKDTEGRLVKSNHKK